MSHRPAYLMVFDLESKTARLHRKIDTHLESDKLLLGLPTWEDAFYFARHGQEPYTGAPYTDVLKLGPPFDTPVSLRSLPGKLNYLAVSPGAEYVFGVEQRRQSEEDNPLFVVRHGATADDPVLEWRLETEQFPYRVEYTIREPKRIEYVSRRLAPVRSHLIGEGQLFLTVNAYEQTSGAFIDGKGGTRTGEIRGEPYVILAHPVDRAEPVFVDCTADFPIDPLLSPDGRYLYYRTSVQHVKGGDAQETPHRPDIYLARFDRQTEESLRLYRSTEGLWSTHLDLIEADAVSIVASKRSSAFTAHPTTSFFRLDTTGTVVGHVLHQADIEVTVPFDEQHYLALELPSAYTPDQAYRREVDHFMVHYLQKSSFRIVQTDTLHFDPVPRHSIGTPRLVAAPADK